MRALVIEAQKNTLQEADVPKSPGRLRKWPAGTAVSTRA